MADIEIGYKGSTITSINSSGVTTLNTIGTFCEDNITVTFNKTQGKAFTPATTITTNPSITLSANTGTITAFYSGASNITPTVTPGYVSAGTAGTVRTSGTSTYQLSTVATQTITPTTASQLAVASGRFTTGSVYVEAIPSTYVQPTGTLTISENGTYNVTDKAEAVVNVSDIPYPTFDVTWSNDWESTVSITCDKTYAECISIYEDREPRCAVIEHNVDETETDYVYGTFYRILNNNLVYVIGSTHPYYDIVYHQDGSISADMPSSTEIEITPTATKGAVSNASVSVTPQVAVPSNGYLVRGTRTGTPVVVSASELVAGTLNITSNGTYDVTEYASVSTNISEAERFAPIYKNLAFRNVLYDSGRNTTSYGSYTASDISDWCDSLICIEYGQFANQLFSGNFTFGNVSSIKAYGFASANLGVGVGGNTKCNLDFPSCRSLDAATFAYNTIIQSVSLPMVSQIKRQAFFNCQNLSYVNINSCTSIDYSAFCSCTHLLSVDVPNCLQIGSCAFQNCSSLTTISFPACESIGSSAFMGCYDLMTADFPSCTSMGTYAFWSCRSLTTVSFSVLTTINSYAFSFCDSLTTISFPACTSINANAFQGCTSLTSIEFSVCKTVEREAFRSCYSLTTISFPACESIGFYAFANCSKLSSVYLPSCTILDSYAFQSCYSLATVILPVCTSIVSYTFGYCYSLTKVILPSITLISTYAFRNCYNLLSIYLLGSSVVSLNSTNAFTSTPISTYTASTGGVYGSIFVRASLYDSYLTATNWSRYSSRFVSLTDAEIEALEF